MQLGSQGRALDGHGPLISHRPLVQQFVGSGCLTQEIHIRGLAPAQAEVSQCPAGQAHCPQADLTAATLRKQRVNCAQQHAIYCFFRPVTPRAVRTLDASHNLTGMQLAG